MQISVFVTSLRKQTPGLGVVVEAQNGSGENPTPFLRFEVQDASVIRNLTIGDRFTVTIEEAG